MNSIPSLFGWKSLYNQLNYRHMPSTIIFSVVKTLAPSLEDPEECPYELANHSYVECSARSRAYYIIQS